MKLFSTIRGILFPVDTAFLFSEKFKEEIALSVATRFLRGNTNSQNGCVTTDRMFAEEIQQTRDRVSCSRYSH